MESLLAKEALARSFTSVNSCLRYDDSYDLEGGQLCSTKNYYVT